MIIIFWLIIALLITTGIMHTQDLQEISINYANITISFPIWMLALASITLIFIAWLCLNIGVKTKLFLHDIKFKNKFKYYEKSNKIIKRSLMALMQKNWANAENFAIKELEYSKLPLLNLLLASKASKELGDLTKSLAYLDQAAKTHNEHYLEIKLLQANLLYSEKLYPQCELYLLELINSYPKEKLVLSLLAKLFVAENKWQQLQELLPKLDKYKVFDKDKILDLQTKLHQNKLLNFSSGNVEALITYWNQIPKKIKRSNSLIESYVNALVNVGATATAFNIAKQQLKYNISDTWLDLYGKITTTTPLKQVEFLEQLLVKNSDSARLFFVLGKLCYEQQLWGKAKDYLQLSANKQPNSETYTLLGNLYEALGEINTSKDYFVKTLTLLESKVLSQN